MVFVVVGAEVKISVEVEIVTRNVVQAHEKINSILIKPALVSFEL